ncbi:hypothetical protein BpHYR1_029121 [Brachionus plicatilis]|uniref:Uncharacterized protein n=1 Tax=Brachionus plicatilis TaxID=10195 RepID=A0A3M7PQX7_BRAPC|nr:hypothetical protein BpHYR1_029121 [Brachionus plicatilis]
MKIYTIHSIAKSLFNMSTKFCIKLFGQALLGTRNLEPLSKDSEMKNINLSFVARVQKGGGSVSVAAPFTPGE